MVFKSIIGATCTCLAVVSFNANAIDKNWVCNDDSWDNPACWSPTGQPLDGDNAYLTQADAVDRIVTYSNSIIPVIDLNSLTINAKGIGTMTLSQSQDSLASDTETIGYDGTGTFTQTGGDNIVNDLYLGYLETGDGTYNLSGTGSLSADNEIISRLGNGTFNQTGGTNTANNFAVSFADGGYGGTGTYNLSGGSLSVINMDIARSGFPGLYATGVFNQSGGSVTVSNRLNLADLRGANGTYNLSDGSLEAGELGLWDVDQTGITGVFNQTGGTVTTDRVVSTFDSFTYNLDGGSLTANTIQLYDHSGQFNQSGGVNTVTDTLTLDTIFEIPSSDNTSIAGSHYTLTDGTLNAGNIVIKGKSTFTQTGGSNTVSGDLSLVKANTYDGGADFGEYTLAGGELSASSITVETGSTFNQSGGTNTANYIAISRPGHDPEPAGGQIGIYNLSGGSLLVDNMDIATSLGDGAACCATGVFNQSGGSVTVSNRLNLADMNGASGTYNLSDGSLEAGELGLWDVDETGITGVFNQTGGTVTTDRVVSTFDSFTYNLDGGSLTTNTIQLYDHSGQFNQSGGVNTVTDTLTLDTIFEIPSSDNTSIAGSHYTLTDGTLNAGNIVIKGKSTFTQTGGRNTVSGDLSIVTANTLDAPQTAFGEYTLAGGALDATSITVESGNTFNFDGGTLSVDNFNGNLVNNGGTLAPGNSPGTTQINGNYTQASDGIFEVEIGGLNQGSEHDWLKITGNATLDGTLDVDLFDLGSGSFILGEGDVFDILSAESITGKFDILTLVALDEGLEWGVSYLTDFSGSTDLVRLTVNNVNVNVLPVANAGIDQIVNEGVVVDLDGQASSDSDGTVDSYSWTQTAGTTVTLTGADTTTPSFTAPSIISDTVLMFSLVVTDNNGDTDTASVTITVNNVLVVDAGTDQQMAEGDIVRLNGLNSFAANGIITSYLWSQTEGPIVILDDITSATPSFIAPAVDVTTLLVFKLVVSDSNGLQDYDTTFVNVGDELLTSVASPLAIQLIDTVVSGNVLYQFDTMSDPFFASANVQWDQSNGPAVTLSDPNTEIPSFMAPTVSVDSATTFEVRSTIDGLIVRAGVNVNILGTTSVNQAPTANAGIDQVVTEGDMAYLDATASTDSDGSIVSYYWQQTGGPMVLLSSIMEAQPSFVAPAIAAVDDGTKLTFELVVTDDGGFVDRQSVAITISDNQISAFADDVTAIITSSGDPIGIQRIMGGSLVALEAVDPNTIVDDDNRPDFIPYGLLDFSLRVEPGATVQVSFELPSAAGTNLTWWKDVSGSGWLDYSAHTTFNGARDVVTITLTDNGIGDDDPALGVIHDPGGLALASAPATDVSSTSSGGEGGSIGPLLLVFLLLVFYARTFAGLHYSRVNTFPSRLTGKVSKIRV